MFNYFSKKINCDHDYGYINKYKPNMMFPCLENTQKYIFKCKKCNHVKNIDNYDVIEKIQEIFIECINKELSKNIGDRLSNNDLKDKVWGKYSNNLFINNTLRNEINVQPIYFNFKDLNSITEQDILNLKFVVHGAWIIYDLVGKELNSNSPYIIYKSLKGKYEPIRYYRFTSEVEEEITSLNEKYLNKGISKEIQELKFEATKNVCKYNKILYSENK